jgi:predicted secreted protein
MTQLREQEITLKAGERFSVVFNQAASAGYLWNVSRNRAGIDVQALSVLVPRSKLRRMGGVEQIEFYGRAPQPGEYEIEFEHKRPWENRAVEAVRLKLKVEPA